MQQQAIDRAATITPANAVENLEEFWQHCRKEPQQLGRKMTQNKNSDRQTKFHKTPWELFSWEQVAKPAAEALCVTFSWSCERSTFVLVTVTELIAGARYK